MLLCMAVPRAVSADGRSLRWLLPGDTLRLPPALAARALRQGWAAAHTDQQPISATTESPCPSSRPD